MDWIFNGNKEVSYEHFAQQALFHPERGYYSNSIPTVGSGGDFSTSATMSSLLARGIANWAINREKLLPLIEVGAGDGSLCRDIVQAIPLLQRWRIDYHIVEASPVLRQQQQGNVSRKVEWNDSVKEALQQCGGEALIFSNELVDAFPPRVFRSEENGFSELHLTKKFTEIWYPATNLPNSSAFDQKWPIGQRLEIHQSYQHWLSEWRDDWTCGEMLTIDYGDRIETLYHRRPQGSLRAFLHHQRLEGSEIYNNPGKQDLTCDVNFTDLIRWGDASGIETTQLQSQLNFLTPHSRNTTTDTYLLHPDGPGSAFLVLSQKAK